MHTPFVSLMRLATGSTPRIACAAVALLICIPARHAAGECERAKADEQARRYPLPAGLAAWNPAGMDGSWEYLGVAFYAFTEKSQDTEPVYGFVRSDGSTVLSTHRIHENSKVAFYSNKRGGDPVYELVNPSTRRVFYSVRKVDGNASNAKAGGIAFRAFANCRSGTTPIWLYRKKNANDYAWVAERQNSYIVGAYYFDMWSPRETRIVESTQRLYGRGLDWWGGVRDFYGKSSFAGKPVPRNTRGEGGSWDHLMPRIGYYDVRSTRTLEKQIEQAADAGLSFFSFYWYWDRESQHPIFGEGIRSFLAASNRSRLKFSIAYFAHPWDRRMHLGEEDKGTVVQKLVDFFAQPEYLRLPDRRPYFVLGDTRNIGDGDVSDVQTFLAVLKRATIDRLGVEPYVSIQVGLPAWQEVGNADGTTCVAAGVQAQGPDSYTSMISRTRILYRLALSDGRPFSPCVTAHFDERPRKDIIPQSGRYLTGRTNDQFGAALEAAKTTADGGITPSSKVISIYAWNEWHEGGVIEPNVQTGAMELNVITTTFHLPRRPSRCLDDGQC